MRRIKQDETNGDLSYENDIDTDIVKPKAQIGLVGAIAFTAGSMIGSGIFISPTGAFASVGSIGMSLVIWLVSGLICMVLGVIHGELGTIIPQSGGGYTYINKGLGAAPAFLAVWIFGLIAANSFAILTLVFADYLLNPIFGRCSAPDIIRKTIAVVVILTLAITNTISVRLSANIQIVCTFAKLVALILISVGGIIYMAQGNTENIETGFSGSSTDVVDYTLALYKCLFAYGGFSRVNDIAEELINPKRNIPRAIIFSILLVTIVYITTNLSYGAVLSKQEMVSSSAVAYDWPLRVIKPAAIIIPLSVMCSTYGSLNGGAFSNGRIMFAAAQNGHYPEVMSYLHVRTSVPVLSVIGTHLIGIILLTIGDIGLLINFSGFLGYFAIGLVCVSLLRIRYRMGKYSPSFRTPLPVIILGLLICMFMVVSPFLDSPRVEFLYGLVFLAVGIIAYIVFVYFELFVPGFDKIMTVLQLVLQVLPTAQIE